MNSKTKRVTTIGMLCAITYVTMVVGRIPIILFLKYDPSDVIVTLGGFIWGPMTSCIVSVIVATLEMITAVSYTHLQQLKATKPADPVKKQQTSKQQER